MARIHRLPDAVVNQIAAGEVVERPASVVKELIENAVDAGAAAIGVRLAAGGRELIEVSDDGCGMEVADALAAFERHATSKISSADDLATIASLGFRGEALPSIAAVSALTLETAPADGEGTRVEIEFGGPPVVRPCARSRGTTVMVRDLFGRVPARRKFLRGEATELRHAVAILSALAFTRPGVAFSLEHGGRSTLRLPAAASAGARLADLVGPERARNARAVEHGAGAVRVTGFLVPGGRDTTLAVNGRVVRDRLLVAAVNRALRDASGTPEAEALLALEVSPAEVDVNVHPTKSEVRFSDPGRVFAALTAAVAAARAALHAAAPVRRIVTVAPSRPPAPAFHPLPLAPARRETPTTAAVAETPSSFDPRPVAVPAAAGPWGRYLGQYRGTYLLLEDGEGLLLVDQHNAHERVLYEALLESGLRAESQPLLLPLVLDLSPSLAAVAAEAAGALRELGFEVEQASSNSVRLLALPQAFGRTDGRALLLGALDDIAAGRAPGTSPRERLAASLACRAAVKKNHPLSRPEAEHLAARLAAARDPHRCPHGRPIVLRLAHDEIERRIGRR